MSDAIAGGKTAEAGRGFNLPHRMPMNSDIP
jgi:hypothetical protein